MVKVKKQKVRLKKKKIVFSGSPRIDFKGMVKFLAGVLLLGIIGIGLVRVKYMFVDSKHFMIKDVEVRVLGEKGPSRDLSLDEVAGKKIVGTNIFFLDLNALKKDIELSRPEFKDVDIRRFLPDKLIVQATLRKAVAQVRSDRYYPIDREGVLLPDVKNFPEPGLPIIAGIGINPARVSTSRFSEFEKDKLGKALSLINEVSSNKALSRYKLKMIDITDPGNLSFFLEGVNIEIKIGKDEFRSRLAVLATVLDKIGPDIDEFKYIDLRFEDPIIGTR